MRRRAEGMRPRATLAACEKRARDGRGRGGAGSLRLTPRAIGMDRPAAAAAGAAFDLGCTACPRLAALLAQVRAEHPDYHARPVPPFGDPHAALLIVGLAPGMHGANRTGRPFTGDYAGILLYRTLHKFGFGSHAGIGRSRRRPRAHRRAASPTR